VILNESEHSDHNMPSLVTIIEGKSKRIQSILYRHTQIEDLFQTQSEPVIDYKALLRKKKAILEMIRSRSSSESHGGYTKDELEFLILKQKAIQADIKNVETKLAHKLKYGDKAQLHKCLESLRMKLADVFNDSKIRQTVINGIPCQFIDQETGQWNGKE
jgi:hypothetical protein